MEASAARFADDLETLAEAGLLAPSAAEEQAPDGDELGEGHAHTETGDKATKKALKKEKKKKEKVKMVSKAGRPAMILCGDLADGWERWAK